MSDSQHGLALLESTTNRVSAWRRRHRARADEVARYVVTHDGTTVADLDAPRTAQGLDDELAAAAWEVAQGLARPATVDVCALAHDGAEVARITIRVQPARTEPASGADLGAVVKVLLEANQSLARLTTDLVGAVAGQLREVSAITTELARASAARAKAAETEAAKAQETASEALALARDTSSETRSAQDRGMDLVEHFLRLKLEAQAKGGAEEHDA